MHSYTFSKCNATVKPRHTLNTDDSGRFITLKVFNYSMIRLFALAAGKGKIILEDNIIVKSNRRIDLDRIISYQLPMKKNDEQSLYNVMLDSLKKHFQEFDVTLEVKEGKNFLVTLDK
jgi:hypothetical protein